MTVKATAHTLAGGVRFNPNAVSGGEVADALLGYFGCVSLGVVVARLSQPGCAGRERV